MPFIDYYWERDLCSFFVAELSVPCSSNSPEGRRKEALHLSSPKGLRGKSEILSMGLCC
jgi:hypothetical protein